jgi:hypothetical protein
MRLECRIVARPRASDTRVHYARPAEEWTMLADRYGLPVSTASEVAREATIAGSDCILAATAGWREHI